LLQEQRNSQTSLYLYADDGYDPLARVDGTGALQQIRYYHNDLNGLPELLTESDGHSVWQARYQVWGNTLQEIREPYYIEEQNLRFQGQYLDRETGLHFNTFRFYDPDIGRFTTPDPIGLAGGVNLYVYAPNPVGWVDPWGWACRSAVSGNKGRTKALQDLKRNGFKVVSEEVTMKVNGKRIRADFVARDKKGKYHVFEVKHGSGKLTRNQKGSKVFDMKNPANSTRHLGGGVVKPSSGTKGTFTVDTHGAPGEPLGGHGAKHDAIFNLLIYK
jgi:RHS repeat-associated protein